MLPYDKPHVAQNPNHPNLFVKAKRKRLAKACDACHKSKRRCDGTAPCSNCYYASKSCTYTDSSGRPVPAPRPFHPERNDPQSSSDMRSQTYATICTDPSPYNQSPHPTNIYSSSASTSNQGAVNIISEDDSGNDRKRIKNERGDPIPTDDAPVDGPISGLSMDRPIQVKLDHSLTRELTNLFFTHCHPTRIIIHKPSFSTALSHNQAPLYLVHAICALAAPLSKQARIRTNPARFAGKPFAQEAMSLMFDGAGRLMCEANLATAQALCLLQIHDIVTKDKNMCWNTRFHDLALQIVKNLGLHRPDHPLLTPLPSAEYIQTSLERESVRRIFWLIQVLDIMISIYFKRPLNISDNDLRIRLPADETSFELAVHSTLPEYLHLRPIKTQYASEFGHLIRVLTIYAKAEKVLDHLTGLKEADTSINPVALVHETEKFIQEWSSLLPDHLSFSQENLSVQKSMFETSSNDGAWCFCCMHVYHASTFIALSNAQQLLQGAPAIKVGPQWATDMLDDILTMLGERGKHSLLMSAILWTYAGLCGREDAQVHAMAMDYEEYCGTRILDLVRNWRSQMSPSKQQLFRYMTPPQKYAQTASFKRRNLPQGSNGVSSPPHQSPIRHSSPAQSTQGDTSNTNSPQPCDVPCTDLLPHISNQTAGPALQRMRPSNNDPDLSHSFIADTMQGGSKRHSPPVSSPSPSPYPKDDHRPAANGKHRHQPLDGKQARKQSITVPLAAIPRQEISHEGAECQRCTLTREHQTVGWDRGQHQAGYDERAKKQNGLPHPSFSGSKNSQQGMTRESVHGETRGSRKPNLAGGSILGDGHQSLPSLKSSGLLDSWAPPRAQRERTHGTEVPPGKSTSRTSHQKQLDVDAPRSLPSMTNTSGMPVGLQWLANESR